MSGGDARAVPSRARSGWRRVVGLVGLEDRVRLVALYGPLLVVDTVLDVLRALAQHSPTARRLGLAALPGNVLVHLGVLGLWALLFAATPTGWRRRLRNLAFHLGVGAYLVFTVAAHLFQQRTGSLLDVATLAGAAAAPAVVGDIVARSAGHQLVAIAVDPLGDRVVALAAVELVVPAPGR